jgi:type II secretory pathway component GspD/PulD (secretin)
MRIRPLDQHPKEALMTRIVAIVLAIVAAVVSSACSTTSISKRSNYTASTEVIPLQYIDATTAAERLQSQRPNAQIVVQSHMNAIVVVGSAAEVDDIRKAVSRIDRPS